MAWTDERVDILKKLWAEGLSASQIAGEVGGGISRNGVIGKVHRLGLSGRKRRTMPRERIIRDKTTKMLRPPVSLPPSELPAQDILIPIAQRKSIFELKDNSCRWPVGDPGSGDFFFCGGVALDGRPYCAGHCARATAEPRPPREVRPYRKAA